MKNKTSQTFVNPSKKKKKKETTNDKCHENILNDLNCSVNSTFCETYRYARAKIIASRKSREIRRAERARTSRKNASRTANSDNMRPTLCRHPSVDVRPLENSLSRAKPPRLIREKKEKKKKRREKKREKINNNAVSRENGSRVRWIASTNVLCFRSMSYCSLSTVIYRNEPSKHRDFSIETVCFETRDI